MRRRDQVDQHLFDPEPERTLHRIHREQRTEHTRNLENMENNEEQDLSIEQNETQRGRNGNNGRNQCDAPKPGGPLTTRQPAEYKWMSGYPTPL